jgi:Ca2+-binding RTX toxin-like protein
MIRSRRRTSTGGRRLFGVLLAVSVGLGFVTTRAFTAANVVPVTNISQFTQAITPAQLAPSECGSNGVTVTSIVSGSGTITSTAANQLVLGSSGVDTLNDGGSGSACLVGGASADSFNGVTGGGDLCIVSSATSGTKIKKCTVVATRP